MDTISTAAYFDVTYQALPRLYLTAGARYSYDQILDAFYNQLAPGYDKLPHLNGYALSPRAVVRYVLNDASNVYFSFSRGYKSAIYNVGGGSPSPVKPEKINAYELGYKYAAHRLSFDLATYYYDYSNLQVASYTDVNGQPASVVNNAANSRIYGLEGQIQYEVTSSVSVNAGAAYTDAKYLDFQGSPTLEQRCLAYPMCPDFTPYGFYFGGSQNEHDTTMLRAPKFTANVGARYTTEVARGDLTFSGNYYFTSKFYFDSSDQYDQKAYSLLGLRAEWTNPTHRYSLALYGDNVTDTHYIASVLANNPGVGAYWGSPAVFGGQVKVYF
jgi:iron complex outermembrane receptor protein